jgi:hypothetical protein
VEPEFFWVCYILDVGLVIEFVFVFLFVIGVPLLALGFMLRHAYLTVRELHRPRWQSFIESRGLTISTALSERALASRRRFWVAVCVLATWAAIIAFVAHIAGPNCFDPPYCQTE